MPMPTAHFSPHASRRIDSTSTQRRSPNRAYRRKPPTHNAGGNTRFETGEVGPASWTVNVTSDSRNARRGSPGLACVPSPLRSRCRLSPHRTANRFIDAVGGRRLDASSHFALRRIGGNRTLSALSPSELHHPGYGVLGNVPGLSSRWGSPNAVDPGQHECAIGSRWHLRAADSIPIGVALRHADSGLTSSVAANSGKPGALPFSAAMPAGHSCRNHASDGISRQPRPGAEPHIGVACGVPHRQPIKANTPGST